MSPHVLEFVRHYVLTLSALERFASLWCFLLQFHACAAACMFPKL